MASIFLPPKFADPERTERATTLFAFVWIAILVSAGALVAIVREQPGLLSVASTPFLVLAPAGLIVLEINRRDRTRLASWLFIATLIALTTFRSLAAGGIRSPGVTMDYVFAFAAGLLLGERAGIATAIVCSVIGLGLVAAEQNGALPPQTIHYTAQTYWWINVIYMGITLFLLSRASRSLRSAFDHAQGELIERRKAEADAIAAKTRLEMLIAGARIGVVVLQDFSPLIANREFARIFGFDSEVAVCAISDIRNFFSGDERELITSEAQGKLSGEDFIKVTSLTCRQENGTCVNIEARFFPIEWEGKIALCAMVTDVTQQMRLEAQLRQSQRLETVGRMTGGLAHDFNNLLTVILANATFLEDQLAQNKLLQEIVSLMRRAAERGADLTTRLLTFSRRQNLELHTVDVGILIAGMEPLLRTALGNNIRIETAIRPNLWHALADAAQLENALLNLAINARDAMPDGGVLSISAANILADLDEVTEEQRGSRGQGEFVLISVSDNGTGMDEETRIHALEPFFTTKDVGKGSGLGLSMVYGFVTQLGGKVRIESEVGRGTKIDLYLPRQVKDQPDIEPKRQIAKMPGGHERILVVEDDSLVREHVVTQLTALGYAVVSAADGIEALEILNSGADFDLLFTDIVMPRGLDGLALAARARTMRPNLPILVTSGYAEANLDDVQFVLRKPYRSEELAASIRNILAQAPPKSMLVD